jgi:hypothetical protein
MANALFTSAREAYLGGDLDWDANDVRLILVDHGTDTPAPTTDDFLNDIGAGARVATSSSFASKTKVGGVADAADVTLSTVSGSSAESIVIYYHTGTESTSNLIAFIDTATGLPVTPNGGDIVIQWANTGLDGAGGIFKL